MHAFRGRSEIGGEMDIGGEITCKGVRLMPSIHVLYCFWLPLSKRGRLLGFRSV